MKSSDSSIPPEVWASMPQELLDRIIAARKEGAKITYNKNVMFSGQKTYNQVEITKTPKNGLPIVSRYNVKNGILTEWSSFGVLSGCGSYYDPETGEPAGFIMS